MLAIEVPNLIWYPLVSFVSYKTQSSTWGQKAQPWVFVGVGLLLIGFGIWFLVTGIQVIL